MILDGFSERHPAKNKQSVKRTGMTVSRMMSIKNGFDGRCQRSKKSARKQNGPANHQIHWQITPGT